MKRKKATVAGTPATNAAEANGHAPDVPPPDPGPLPAGPRLLQDEDFVVYLTRLERECQLRDQDLKDMRQLYKEKKQEQREAIGRLRLAIREGRLPLFEATG